MPVEDGCQIEQDAYLDKFSEAEEFCNQAMEKLSEWEDAKLAGWEECSYLGNLGGGWGAFLEELEKQGNTEIQDQLTEDIEKCVDDLPEVADAWNDYLDHQAACEIAREEAEAIREEYDVCLHSLHEGIPFA